MAEKTERLNIYQKLARIRKQVEVIQKNRDGYGYRYVTEDEILARISVFMDKYGLSLLPGIVAGTGAVTPYAYTKTKAAKNGKIYEEHVNEMIVQSDMSWTWINNDEPSERIEVPWLLVGQQSDASQAFGAGLTYANRYFLLKFFNIATPDADPDSFRSKQKKAEAEESRMVAEEIVKELDARIREFLRAHKGKSDAVKQFAAQYASGGNYRAIKNPETAAKMLTAVEEMFETKESKTKENFELSLVTACIRPSGASYRDELIARKPHRNPSELIDRLLANNNGYLVYQEDIIAFLQSVWGLSGSEADTVRCGIARKKTEILEQMLPRILDGYCARSDKPRRQAETEARAFLQIIEDASSYMFGKNHAIAYSLITYLCAWLRRYHPLEFITAYLNHAASDADIEAGSQLAQEYGVPIIPPRYGESTDVYLFDREKRTIAKGVGSIRDMNRAVSRELYELSRTHPTDSFMTLLRLMKEHTSLRSNQLDHLIKIDYFRAFGNVPTLSRINELFQFFKQGEASKIRKEKAPAALEPLLAAHGTDRNGKGEPLKSWTITDMPSANHTYQPFRQEGLPAEDNTFSRIHKEHDWRFAPYQRLTG